MSKISRLRLSLKKTGGISEQKCFGLGIGGQRCGSTWIGKYLSNHPDHCMSPIKEMHIFDTIHREKVHPLRRNKLDLSKADNQLKKSVTDIEKIIDGDMSYFRYFDERINNNHRSFGEITPEYSLLGNQFLEIIAASHGNIKLFMSLRCPTDRFLSALTYYGRKRPKFSIERHYRKGLQKKLFCNHTRYTANIKNILSHFPRENIYFFYYEDLFNGSTDTLFQLCDHLQIKRIHPKDNQLPYEKTINNTSKPSNTRRPNHEEMKAIYNQFRSEYEAIPDLIQQPLPQKWQEDIAQLAS